MTRPGDLLRLQLLEQPQRRDLALVLVAVVAGEHEHGRPLAVRDRGDRDEGARPAAGVRDLRERELADLLAGRGEVDRAGDRGSVTRVPPAPRRPRPRSPRAGDRRPRRCARTRSGSASGSAAARRSRPHQLAPVADEQVDVVRGAGRRSSRPAPRGSSVTKTEPKPDDDGRHAEPGVERAQPRRACARRAGRRARAPARAGACRASRAPPRVVAGCPLKVPAKNAGCPGVVENRSISSALPPSAETGQPFAIALPERRQVGRDAGDRPGSRRGRGGSP